jgi:hypothetical protein
MTAERKDHSESEQASEIIRNLYLARFTQHAMRCVSMSLASSYMDADITGASIRWEDTAACPLLKLVTEFQDPESGLVVKDERMLNSYSEFVQTKVSEFVMIAGAPGGLQANWVPESLVKFREFATRVCLPLLPGTGDRRLESDTLDGLSELAAVAFTTLESSKMRSLRAHLTISRAFTLKAVEQFTTRAQELHQGQQTAAFSYFESFKAFAPLLYVASSIYELVGDRDIDSLDALNSHLAKIRRQFSATDELHQAAQEECNQMLELCLSDSFMAGNQALGRQLEAT